MTGPDAPHERPGIESLGTPADIRAAQPEIVPEPGPPAASQDWQANRRHGFVGMLDSIAYGVQFLLLSLYATADQPRQSDPIERLRLKYGRPPRRF